MAEDFCVDGSLCVYLFVVLYRTLSLTELFETGFYPRLLLLLPHIALISIILSTYPYPDKASTDPIKIYDDGHAATSPATEGSVPWQANITGIQNLMGAVYVAILYFLTFC